jgi:hypothetical protein
MVIPPTPTDIRTEAWASASASALVGAGGGDPPSDGVNEASSPVQQAGLSSFLAGAQR